MSYISKGFFSFPKFLINGHRPLYGKTKRIIHVSFQAILSAGGRNAHVHFIRACYCLLKSPSTFLSSLNDSTTRLAYGSLHLFCHLFLVAFCPPALFISPISGSFLFLPLLLFSYRASTFALALLSALHHCPPPLPPYLFQKHLHFCFLLASQYNRLLPSLSDSNTCRRCPENCKRCTTASICTECKPGLR